MSKFGLTGKRYNQMMEFYHNNERTVKDIVETWGAENCNKGYDVFNYDGTGLLEIEAIGDVEAFDSDDEAVKQAVLDGIEIIPIEQLPINMPKNMRFYGWIDTEENRRNIAKYCRV